MKREFFDSLFSIISTLFICSCSPVFGLFSQTNVPSIGTWHLVYADQGAAGNSMIGLVTDWKLSLGQIQTISIPVSVQLITGAPVGAGNIENNVCKIDINDCGPNSGTVCASYKFDYYTNNYMSGEVNYQDTNSNTISTRVDAYLSESGHQ